MTFASAAPGAPVELTAPIPGGIDGEVREHVTGAGVARARRRGRRSERPARSTAVAKKGDGAFRLARLAPGHWTLTAQRARLRATVRDVDVPESPILGETSVRGLRLELDLDR